MSTMTARNRSSLALRLLVVATAACCVGCASPPEPPAATSGEAAEARNAERPPYPGDALPRAQVLLLGTFHFDDPGLDDYKPAHRFDVLSEKRQREVEEVLDRLAAFQPTRIAVEVRASRQATLDERYQQYLSGESEPSPDEIVQIGYRLAARLGHERVYAVDAAGRSYFPDMTDEEWEARTASLLEGVDPARIEAEEAWDARFEEMYRYYDELKTRQTLREHLITANDEERLLAGHGAYLVGGFKLGRGDDYFGVDGKTRWFNRNLRIFQNIQRIPQSPEDRILVVIGAGHVPILRHCVQASPEYELVEVRDVLEDL